MDLLLNTPNNLEFIMKKLLAITITAVLILGMYGIAQPDSYATKSITKQTQQPSDNATIRPERQFQQSSEAPGATTTQPERQQSQQPSEATTTQPERQQSQQPSEGNTDRQNGLPFETEQPDAEDQQEDEPNGNVELKDEQIKGVEQEDESEGANDDDENNDTNGDDENEIDARPNEADKKAPIAISGDNIYVMWFSDQNTPSNNSEVLFRFSNDGGVTFADKINLSNTTTADSIDAQITADGNNVVITWWETNQTSDTPVMRVSNDNGETFGTALQLSTNGTIGQATQEEE
jgi:hypothetical protein